MTRIRSKKSRLRIKKYRKKVRPREINLAFKENVSWYSVNLKDYLRLDNLLEREVLDLLEKNVKLGLIKKEEKDLYLAFWRKALSEGQRYSSKTLEKDLEDLVNEFVLRGLLKDKLLEIIELVKDQLSRKEFFHEVKEWSVIQDWLKFKAFAYVLPTYLFQRELLPFRVLEFYYNIRPLAYRVFTLKPQKAFQFIKYVLPTLTRVFSLNLRDGFTLQFLYEVSRYLTFVFSLRPKTILLFDYELSVPYFRRFELMQTVGYEFSYSILPLAIRVFSFSGFYRLSLFYSVRPIPLRIFEIKRFYKLLFNAYSIIPKLMYSEITPIPKMIFLAYTPTVSKQQTELKPKVRVQLSYSTRPA